MFAIAMGWRHLLFEHYPVDPSVVARQLPEGLEVDTYDGDAWLSVVPFTNVDVRPLGLPRAAGFPLPELNLRTYVTHGNDRGVYFFSLDADGLLGVAGARLFHHLPYYYADIDLSVREAGTAGVDGGPAGDPSGDHRVRFEHRRRHPGARPAEYAATYEPVGEVSRAEPGSLASFLTDRYCYYTASPRGLLRADVEHERWPLQDATATVDRNDLVLANGFATPEAEPVRQYCRAVDVYASRGRRVD